MALILTNANLIDCVNPSPIAGASVIIEGRRITQVLSAGVPTINAGDVPYRALHPIINSSSQSSGPG